MILKDKDYSRNSTSIIKIIIKMIAMIIIDQTITFISWTLQPGLQRDHKDPQVATRLSTLVSKIEIGVEILIELKKMSTLVSIYQKCKFWVQNIKRSKKNPPWYQVKNSTKHFWSEWSWWGYKMNVLTFSLHFVLLLL